jgi:hypothetical protein
MPTVGSPTPDAPCPLNLLENRCKSLPFDIKDVRTIEYKPTDLASTLELPLKEAIQQTLVRYRLEQQAREHALFKVAQRFWEPFADGGVNVLIGRFKDFASFEPSGLVGVGDSNAHSELRAYFNLLGFKGISTSYADLAAGEMLQTNLVLLGGPDANSVTREAVPKINSTFRFGNPDHRIIALYDSSAQRTLVPKWSADQYRIVTDYAIIFVCANPFATGKHLLLVAGSFGYGTWAGGRFVASHHFVEKVLNVGGTSVECLIETDVVQDAPQDIRLLGIRPLQ